MLTLLCLWSVTSFANVVTTKIHEIIAPLNGDSTHLILAHDGLVYEIDASDEASIKMAYEAQRNGFEVELNLDSTTYFKNALNERDSIVSISLSSKEKEIIIQKKSENNIPTPMDGYNSTTLSSFDSAVNLFRSMRTDTRWRSQCYNRAHVWTYEASKIYNINLKKVWLFFTRKYIQNYKYKWWFHVSPIVSVDGVFEDVVLDREFTKNPTEFTEWKNIFMHNNARCPEVKYYSKYSQNQWSEDCYIIKSSKYYWQPFNIENLEKGEAQKTHWVESEINRAYSNGVRGQRRY